jgi:hypothetical protein
MTQRGYPGIQAGMPTAQYLRSASVVDGAPEIKSLRGGLIAGLALLVVHRSIVGAGLPRRRPNSRPVFPGRTPIHCGSEPARDEDRSCNIHIEAVAVFGALAVETIQLDSGELAMAIASKLAPTG